MQTDAASGSQPVTLFTGELRQNLDCAIKAQRAHGLMEPRSLLPDPWSAAATLGHAGWIQEQKLVDIVNAKPPGHVLINWSLGHQLAFRPPESLHRDGFTALSGVRGGLGEGLRAGVQDAPALQHCSL